MILLQTLLESLWLQRKVHVHLVAAGSGVQRLGRNIWWVAGKARSLFHIWSAISACQSGSPRLQPASRQTPASRAFLAPAGDPTVFQLS